MKKAKQTRADEGKGVGPITTRLDHHSCALVELHRQCSKMVPHIDRQNVEMVPRFDPIQ